MHQNLTELVEKQERGCGIDIFSCNQHEVQIGVLHIQVRDAVIVEHRGNSPGFFEFIQSAQRYLNVGRVLS